MNKKITLICLLGIALLGCKKEVPTDETVKTPVRFEIEENVTRTITDGSVTRFVAGDKIGITSSGLDGDMANAEYTMTGEGTLSGEVFYYDGRKAATFYAHYPYTAQYNDGVVKMTVEGDQSTEESYNASDFMTSIAEGDPVRGGTVSFKMYHRLTLVKIIWNGSVYSDAATLHDIKRTVTWIHSDNSLKLGENISDIITWKVAADKNEYWAVIPAQTITKGSKLLTVEDADKYFEYIAENDITFNSNTIKKITLDVKANGAISATFNDLDIEDWQNDDMICQGTVDEYEAPAIELISPEAGKNITLQPGMKKATAEAGKWNVANNNVKTEENPEGTVIETITEAGETVLHMNIKSKKVENEKTNEDGTTTTEIKELSTWWDNAVYFRPEEKTATKIRPVLYKLSFDVKASEIEKGFMVQIMKGDESSNIYFGIANTDPTIKDNVTFNRMYYPVLKTTEEYVHMEYWVDFSKVINTKGDVTTEGKVGDYDKVLLTLSINTGSTDANAYGVDFYFKNFSFVQIK